MTEPRLLNRHHGPERRESTSITLGVERPMILWTYGAAARNGQGDDSEFC
jgi:hypothetical protein